MAQRSEHEVIKSLEGGQHKGQIKGSSQHNQERDLQQQLDNVHSSKHSGSETFSHQRKGHQISANDPQPSSSFQVSGRRQQSTDYSTANDRLEEFVKYFVKELEAKLHAYHLILEGEAKKAGEFSDAFSEKVGQGVGGAIGGLIGILFGSPVAGAKLGATAGKAGGGKLGSKIGSEQHKKKVTNLLDLIDLSQKDKTNFRQVLVEAGFNVFQSFEMQFMRVTTEQGPRKAMQQLAEDATNRAINYYTQKKDALITEGVVLGESKVESVLGVPIATSKIKTPGFEINYKYKSSEEKWYTASLYEKVGLVIEGKTPREINRYYEKKDGKSRSDKYGYRRLFTSESWNKLKDKYRSSDVAKSGGFTDYPYITNSKDLEQKSKDILKVINLDDESLVEGRITKIIEEVKDDIVEGVNLLKKQSCGYKEDRMILANIEANLINLQVDEYLEKFKQYFEEAKQERQKIARSIEGSREENRKKFNQLSQKQDIHHDDNKREHKTTQVGVENANQGISHLQKGQEVIINEIRASGSKDQDKKPVWFNVKEPVTLFTGRKQELSDVHNKIQRGSEKVTVVSQMTSVSGLGGIGKTELVREYIHKHAKDYDSSVIWINAENEGTLTESFRRLAEDKLRINTKDINDKQKDIKFIVEEVYTFFSKRKSLFIFDNVEKSEYFNKFLPLHSLTPDGNKPYILITSRNREWEKGVEILNLNEFKFEDAIEFVKKSLSVPQDDKSQDKEIESLVEKLQRFPLALEQAVAYIEDQGVVEEFGISDYLKKYAERTKDLLNSDVFKGIDNDYARTTFTTWQITIDKIASNEQNGKLALSILDNIAYFAPENINREIFLSLAEDNEEQLKSAVRLLVKYSMVNGEQKQSILNIHRLVQEVTRLKLKEQNSEEEILRKTFKLLEYTFHYGDQDYTKKRQLVPHLEAHLSHVDDWLARNPVDKQKIEKDYLKNVLICTADGYGDLGEFQKQKQLLERALEIEEKHYGPEDFEVAKTLNNLGNVYGDLGDIQQQKELLERALAIKEKHCGSDHFEVARTLVNLGSAYGGLGDYQKKKELLERALAVEEKHYGPEHFEVGKTLNNLGNVYGDLGDTQKQNEFLKRALAIKENHYGPEHFEVAKTLVNLGRAYDSLGDYHKKKQLIEKALAIEEKHYGPEHFQVAKTLVNLSSVYGNLGDTQKQKELLERALAIKEKHYGTEHFEVAGTLVNLGSVYGDSGEPQKQKELLERALVIEEKHYGSEHFEVASTLNNLANAYGNLGSHQKKKDLLERALAIKEKHYGTEHFVVARTLVNLGSAYGVAGEPQKQKELLERALVIEEKHYGSDHFEVASTLNNLANAYGDLGSHQKKKELLERALAIKEKHYGPEHFKVASTLINLGNAYGNLDDHQKKKELLERALAIEEKHYGSEHFEVSRTLNNLANAYGDLGSHQKKKELLERALAIKEKHYGTEHLEVARSLVNLGSVYGDSSEPQKQKELLERALAIEEKHYGSDHFEVASTLNNLANAYGDLGSHQKKKELLERVLAIEEKHYGSDHFEVASTLNNLANAYGNLGFHQKKKKLLERALASKEKYYGPEHFKVANTLVNLGNAYGNLDDYQEKKDLLERALVIEEEHYGPEHFEVARTLVNLADAYEHLGIHQKKKELLQRALAIEEKHYGPDHFKVDT